MPWGDGTLIEHVIDTLRPLVDDVIVVVRDASKFEHLRARVLEDEPLDAHALGGLYTGLRAASHQLCFVCACDMPFLSQPLIRFLVRQADECDLVIPRTTQGLQPLHAVYTSACLPAIEKQLSNRRWDLRTLVSKVRAKVIDTSVVHQFDPDRLSCSNLNTLEEYHTAREIQKNLIRVMEPSSRSRYSFPKGSCGDRTRQMEPETTLLIRGGGHGI